MPTRQFIKRCFFVITALLCLAIGVCGEMYGRHVWGETSYRFVFPFLLIILYSNICAKLAIAYMDA